MALEAVLLDDGPLGLAVMGLPPGIEPAADHCDRADERRGYD
jgi:hypothetical protein